MALIFLYLFEGISLNFTGVTTWFLKIKKKPSSLYVQLLHLRSRRTVSYMWVLRFCIFFHRSLDLISPCSKISHFGFYAHYTWNFHLLGMNLIAVFVFICVNIERQIVLVFFDLSSTCPPCNSWYCSFFGYYYCRVGSHASSFILAEYNKFSNGPIWIYLYIL